MTTIKKPQALGQNRRALGAAGGNAKMRQAIRLHCVTPVATKWDEEAATEAAMQEAQEFAARGKEKGMIRNHWTDQARFRYNGRRTSNRKGKIRNNVERRVIEHLSRKS